MNISWISIVGILFLMEERVMETIRIISAKGGLEVVVVDCVTDWINSDGDRHSTAEVDGQLYQVVCRDFSGAVFAPAAALAWKRQDPIETARWVFDEDDYHNIKNEDQSLLCPVAEYARELCEGCRDQ
jgi:hypothetical protein